MTSIARTFIILGALLAGSSVALQAYFAHSPSVLQATDAARSALTQALQMQQLHAVGLLVVGLLQRERQNTWWLIAGVLMVLGTLLFCFNLYARYLADWHTLHAMVPWGGSAFMLGWIALAVGALLAPRHSRF